jgi:hypothetical protein
LKDGDGLDLVLPGKVTWVRQETAKTWIMRLELDSTASQAKFKSIFEDQVLDRREDRRYSIRGQATARWETSPGEVNVGLQDLSVGGFSMLTPFLPSRESHVFLKCNDRDGQPIEIEAAAQWQLELGEGYVVGCKFVDDESFLRLRDVVCETDSTKLDETMPKRSLSLMSMVGIVVLVWWYCTFAMQF